MNPGGDAAEQVVRLSLEGVEVAARISGAGAKNITVLLCAVLKEEQKTKGRARLGSMLKTGKELKVYTVRQQDLKKFCQEAKRYGVLYCVLKERGSRDPNAAVDVIARAEDASKIQRITERFRLATVSTGRVQPDPMQTKALEWNNRRERSDTMKLDKAQIERAAREAKEPGTSAPEERRKAETRSDPSQARTETDPLSARGSRPENRSGGSTDRTEKRPSVRKKLKEYEKAKNTGRRRATERGASAPKSRNTKRRER